MTLFVAERRKNKGSATYLAFFVAAHINYKTMKKGLLKQIGIYAGIVLLFVGIAYGFVPEVLQGKIVDQSDIAGWRGMANEAITHNKTNPDDQTAWTNSMFGGMPTTAITDNFEGDWTKPLYRALLLGKRPASYLLVTLIGAFLLMLSMGTRKVVAIAGAIAMAFCSYNMQIIQVGHNTKMQAIAFFPWVLAGVIFTYKAAMGGRLPRLARNDVKETCNDVRQTWKEWLPKTVLGAVLFALALSMQIKANHIQITYYLAIVIFIFAIALFIYLVSSAEGRASLGRFFTASALLLVVGVIGIATNANKLLPTYEYTPYTMRGGSELTSDDKNHNNEGLSLDYATAWSYGINEMPNLLIPNFNGGASAGALDEDSATGAVLKRAGYRGRELKETLSQMPLYWGPQPFTAGPMYMGAISVFLFLLGMIVCKGRTKWWMFAAVVVTVLLSWGCHFMWFTRLWFEYAPFYNKFRTVSMSLVTLQFLLPLLGFYALDKVLCSQIDHRKAMKGLGIAYGVTAGFCLLMMLIPSLAGSFEGASDSSLHAVLADSIAEDRMGLLKADALRSFILISVAAGLIFWAIYPKGKEGATDGKRIAVAAAAISLVVLFDLTGTGKRYLNSSHFTTPRNFEARYNPRPVDKIIAEDTDLSYRVLDISENTFNSSLSSYHHKSIGGYSPVKLQRYQDLIDKYLTPEIRQVYDVVGKSATVSEVSATLPYLKVISMLNGRYIILGGEYPPVDNAYAMGNCWFVDSFVPAANPDEEIALLASTYLSREAVVGKDFQWAMDLAKAASDKNEQVKTTSSSKAKGEDKTSIDMIAMTHYAPNELRYAYKSSSTRPVIFSEIYYPDGWKAWIEPDGAYGEVRGGHYQPTDKAQPLEIFRANWILRGAILPEGEGEIVMRFEPDSYQAGEDISRASSITLLLLLLLSVVGMILPYRKKD